MKFDNCCRGPCQISKRCDDLNYQSRSFETLRDLTIRRLIRYWDRAQKGSLTGWKQGIQIIINLFCFLRNYFDAIHLTASTFWFRSYISYFNDEQRHAISKTGVGFLFNLSYLASILRLLKFSLWTLTAQATHRNSVQRFYVANIHVFSCCIAMYVRLKQMELSLWLCSVRDGIFEFFVYRNPEIFRYVIFQRWMCYVCSINICQWLGYMYIYGYFSGETRALMFSTFLTQTCNHVIIMCIKPCFSIAKWISKYWIRFPNPPAVLCVYRCASQIYQWSVVLDWPPSRNTIHANDSNK